jgi:6,7-dimethyl-8-ribityllumazine synthase
MAKPQRAKSAKNTKSATTKVKKGKGPRILVVESRFYNDISNELLDGAKRVLDAANAEFDRIAVPGSLEIPTAIQIALDAAEKQRKPYDGVVALGCVIQGETFHFDIVAMQSARALMDLSVSRRIPIGNGILTVDTMAQAWARARPDEGNKGGDAARAALVLIDIKLQRAKR